MEEQEEEDAATGTVDTLSNKANHSAVVLFCHNRVSVKCFQFYFGTYIEAGLVYKHVLCERAEREIFDETEKPRTVIRRVSPFSVSCCCCFFLIIAIISNFNSKFPEQCFA